MPLGGLHGELLAALVGRELERRAEHLGLGHLGGDGALPDQVVELLLLRGPFDLRIRDESRADGLVGLLRTFGMGLELARVGILRAEVVQDELLGGAERQRGQVGGVRTHVGDQTALVEGLGEAHRQADRETELARCLLLQGGRGEWRRGVADGVLLLDGSDAVGRADAVGQEGARLLRRLETGVQHPLDFGALRQEGTFHTIIRCIGEGDDLFLTVHDEPERDGLHAAGGQAPAHLAPQDRGQFEADETVQHAAGLLGVHQVVIDVAGIQDGVVDGIPGNLVEDDAAGAAAVQAERLDQVPGNGLPFPVLIGSEPDDAGLRGGLLEFGHHLALVGGNDVFGFEPRSHVHAEAFFLQVPDMSETRFNRISFPQIILDGVRLGRRLDND